tara:strand:- start:1471 stop:1659 length:189 start_codon:yes stop_codon:yes gene_type:complete
MFDLELENDYVKQYPNEENPFFWALQFPIEEIEEFVRNRKGRKVLIEEDPEAMDGGKLIYGE